jgi:hypothetical protein
MALPNNIKTAYQSLPNLIFIGVTAFLSLAVHPAFLFILLAGELGMLIFANTPFMQNILRARIEREQRREQEKTENQILTAVPDTYKTDFSSLRKLCADIESRTRELGSDQPLMAGILEKLYSLRLEYVRMLRAHFLLSNRNYSAIEKQLDKERGRLEEAVEVEQSEQVRSTIDQHLQILRQRLAKARQLRELVRLIEARMHVVNDSLQLIQDEVYSLTDIQGISNVVDDLLVKLQMNEEFRTYYNDVLDGESPALAGPGPELGEVYQDEPKSAANRNPVKRMQ